MRKEEKIAKAVMEALERATTTWKRLENEERQDKESLSEIVEGEVYVALKEMGFEISIASTYCTSVHFFIHDGGKTVWEIWGDLTSRSVEVKKLRVVECKNFIFNR